jgi:hypothetical protein
VDPTGADDLLLNHRHGLGRELDPQIAARDHGRVGRTHDRVQALDGVRRLDLRDDRRGLALALADLAQLLHLLGAPHERERDEIHPDR